MKITICGSTTVVAKKVEIKKTLEKMGHTVFIHQFYEDFINGKNLELAKEIKENHGAAKRKHGFIKWYYDRIVESDAILVLNFDKNGIKNYVGGNTLMEIGFAHVHSKKVFLYNPIPKDVSYTAEIEAMCDEVINGDLSKIK